MKADTPSGLIDSLLSLGGSTLASIILGFLSVGICARLVPEEPMGLYLLILAVVYFLSVFGDVGFQSSIVRFLANAIEPEDRQRIFENVLSVVLVSLLAVVLLTLLVRPLLLFLFSDQIATVFGFVPVLYYVQTLDQTLAGIMQGLKQYGRMAIVQWASSGLNLGLIVVFLAILRAGLEGLLLATLLTSAGVVLLRVALIPLPKRLRFDWPLTREMIRFGLPLQANNILTFISQRLDMLLLGALATPTTVAYLGMASKIPQNLQRLYQAIYAVFFPHMTALYARQQEARAAATLNRFLRLSTLMTTGSALLALFFQDEIMLLIFSERYLPSAPGFGLLMVVLCLSVMTNLLDHTLIAAGHPGYLPLISLADTVPSVIANLLLVPTFGFMGAVSARLIANIMTSPVSIWGVKRERIGVQMSLFFKPMIFMAVCYGLVAVVGPHSIVVRGAGIGLFLVLCAAFGVVTAEDVSLGISKVWMRWHRPALDR